MNFLAPAAFAFAAAIPVVILFYLLKRKRVVKLVSSTLLWQKFLAETQASAPFQKLRKNWLLILQIILLALTVLALSRPFFKTRAKPAELRVIILDTSASMQATDESPSRFEKARSEALKWVDSLANTDQMVILQAGANTEVKQSATSEKAALRRALQACICSDGPTRLVPALRMAESLVRDQRRAEIHLFSDGAVPELRKVLLGSGARSEDDAEVQLGTIRALASIGTSAALSVLEAAVSRRAWFWRRAERRVRDLAAQTLSARKPRARVSPKAVDDR